MSVRSLARRSLRRSSVSHRLTFRLCLAALLFFAMSVAAEAYTLVLRSGRHVTVPDDFRVTPAAITYEAAPGFWVTVWLSNVDIAATEKANAEPAGAFARRVKQEPEAGADAPTRAPEAAPPERGGRRKVVTNQDLEPSRLRRLAQEEEYERTRRERGMPSRQELQRRIEEQDRWLREWAGRMQAERVEAELEALRSELVNVRRQLNELNLHISRQAASPAAAYPPPGYYPYFYTPPAQIITILPFGHRGHFGRGHFRPHPHGRPWLQHPRPGQSLAPVHLRPSRGAAIPPRASPAPRPLR